MFNFSAHEKPPGKTITPFTKVFSRLKSSCLGGEVTSSGRPVHESAISIAVQKYEVHFSFCTPINSLSLNLSLSIRVCSSAPTN